MSYTKIDLSKLPSPQIIEELDFETILAEMIADLKARTGDEFSADLVESDPIMKNLEANAYRELGIRQRVNEAARAVMLAYSLDADLDNLAAFYSVKRGTLTPGDDTAVPPVFPTYESNKDLRRRTQLAPEGMTTAGSEGSYIFHGLSAGDQVLTVDVASPEPGKTVVTYNYGPEGLSAKVKDISAQDLDPAGGIVEITVLGRIGDGTPDNDLLSAVTEHLNHKYVRPLTDQVNVSAATIQSYTVEAVLHIEDGPDPSVLVAEANKRCQEYVDEVHKLGGTVARSGIDHALHIGGVRKVIITKPAVDIETDLATAPHCSQITLTTSGGI
ncbi:baseplate assembly protein [Kiloniella litopenaei]|uniref:baseplate assembly protein n=1 Tax=Kiloniella litopenaei TaxID=1549748 RepID=UPI003BAD4613